MNRMVLFLALALLFSTTWWVGAQFAPGGQPAPPAEVAPVPPAPKPARPRPKPRPALAPPADSVPLAETAPEPVISPPANWADSVLATLTPEQRLGQLFMVAAFSNRDQAHVDEISRLITENHLGGLCFFQGGPVRQARLTNHYQRLSKVPLFISIDGEWGLGMRLDSTISYPLQMTLGAIEDDKAIYEMGTEVARQFRRLGIHINFAPDVDINNNPANPVINARSFGEDRDNVSRKALAYLRGMQDGGLMGCAKHFPGHGDTNVDSHYGLPVISGSRAKLDSLELYPFRQLFAAGVASAMVSHLQVPAIDPAANRPATISAKITTDLLQKELAFSGLIFTDAMNMKGVTNQFKTPGEADLQAFLAGHDVILYSADVPAALQRFKDALAKGEISQAEVDRRCRKILQFKERWGAKNPAPVDLNNLHADLHTPQAGWVRRKLTELSLTLLQNQDNLLPLQKIGKGELAALAIGGNPAEFHAGLGRYASLPTFRTGAKPADSTIDSLASVLKKYKTLIVSVHGPARRPSEDGLPAQAIKLLEKLAKKHAVATVFFTNPYNLSRMKEAKSLKAALMAYEDNIYTQDLAAQALFGGAVPRGSLPVSVLPHYPLGTKAPYSIGPRATDKGARLPNYAPGQTPTHRLKYTVPEELGLDRQVLAKADSLARLCVSAQAAPGCVVLAAQHGKVFYFKAFGQQVFDGPATQLHDIYDLASITKISTSVAAAMKLTERGKFGPDKTWGQVDRRVRRSNKAHLLVREVLTHQAGLKAWIPFWKTRLDATGHLQPDLFKPDSAKAYPTRVASGIFVKKNFAADSLLPEILASPLTDKGEYVYSDLSYYFYPSLVKKLSGDTFEEFLQKQFYEPLGATTLGFNPWKKYPLAQIVPTEYDSAFRRQLLHGTVHDEGAALFGGVSGHAGLFGSANDLAKLIQMYLNQGWYGGQMYLAPATLAEFTRCQYCDPADPTKGNQRALGFDRPRGANVAPSASARSFGHSGFTGTFTWADPENGLLYVFLSNRVYPTRNNNKLSELNIRTGIQEVFYEAITKAKRMQ
ncbi:MAG: serine hydrolase [Bernardetiaceae bacterium]|nr:serine hydrolase [Bernardetiaceae bacterium]